MNTNNTQMNADEKVKLDASDLFILWKRLAATAAREVELVSAEIAALGTPQEVDEQLAARMAAAMETLTAARNIATRFLVYYRKRAAAARGLEKQDAPAED